MSRLRREGEENTLGQRRRSRSNRADGRRADAPKGKGRSKTEQARQYGTSERRRSPPRSRSRGRSRSRRNNGGNATTPKVAPARPRAARTPSPPQGKIGDRTLYHHLRDKTEKKSISRNFKQRGTCSQSKKPYCRFPHECAWCFKKDVPVIKCNCSRPMPR